MRSFLGRIVRDDVSAADAVRDPPDIPVVPVALEDIAPEPEPPVPDIPVDPVVVLPIVPPVPVVVPDALPIGRVVVVDEVDPIGRVVVVPLVFGGFAGYALRSLVFGVDPVLPAPVGFEGEVVVCACAVAHHIAAIAAAIAIFLAWFIVTPC